MKSLFLVISIFAFSLSIFAQKGVKDNFTNNHEISFSIDDIFSSKEIDHDPYESPYGYSNDLYNFFTYDLKITRLGFGYKYHFAKSALRSKLTFRQNKNNIIKPGKEEKSDYLLYELFLGYEFNKTLNKTQIFYGADLFFNYYNINAEYKNIAVGSESLESYKYKKTGFGISPLIGVKYFISPMISISSEMKFIIERYNGDYIMDYDAYTPDTNHKYVFDGNHFKIGPLGNISINIHL